MWRVIATFETASGQVIRENVTPLAVMTPSDPDAIAIDAQGHLKITRGGCHSIAVRFLDRTATFHLTAPLGQQAVDLSTAPRANWIDDEIYGTLDASGCPYRRVRATQSFCGA